MLSQRQKMLLPQDCIIFHLKEDIKQAQQIRAGESALY